MPEQENQNHENENSSGEIDIDKIPISMEKDLDKLNRLIEAQGFQTKEQVDKYLTDVANSASPWPEIEPKSPLEKAQQLAYDAWEAPTRKEAIDLAKKALKISPDCADAFNILAEERAYTLEEALYYYKEGVAAGKRALGPEKFKNYTGGFWGALETRPYMRALAGVAECLWDLGNRRESMSHYKSMLRLNPNDNQGIRYVLAAHAIELGDIKYLKKLLAKYDEPTAAWMFSQALVVFIEQGDSDEAREALRLANKCNRYAIPYLTGQKKLPKQLPVRMGIGDRREAICYAAEFGNGWLHVKGAIDWLQTAHPALDDAQSKARIKGIPKVFLKAFESDDEQKASAKKTEEIYTFKVSLKAAPAIWRKIEVKGNQTLDHLHQAIFEAFDRSDYHLYAFFMSNKAWDETSEYGLPHSDSFAKNAKRTRINSLGLLAKQKFLYIFDFGDDWQHTITLLRISEEVPAGKYPRVIESRGESPPQYPDLEDE